MKILVTGATGKTASLVIDQLRAKGADVRALVRDPNKAPKDVELAVGHFDDKPSLAKAVEGVDTVFLVTPPHPEAAKWAKNLLDVAKTQRIVRLSALKASLNGPTANTRSHGEVDQAIVENGNPYTILRPNYFMQNRFGAAPQIMGEGKLYYAWADAKVGAIDVRDIADCAAAAILDRKWDYGIYELTGAAPVSGKDIAATVAKHIGKDVQYVSITPEAVFEALKGWGDWGAGVMRDYSRAYASGWGDYSTTFVQQLTGHAPRDFDTFTREVFAPAAKR